MATLAVQAVTVQASKRHRVLALVTDAFGGYGGIAQYNRDILAALASCKTVDDIVVLPRITPDALEILPGKICQLPPLRGRAAYAASALRAAWRLRPTVIFGGHLYHAELACCIARLFGAKLVTQVHGTEIWGDVRPKYSRALEAADLVLAVSRDTRAKVLIKTRQDASRVLVLNNTVGADFEPGDRATARARYGLENEFALLTVARLDRREGYKGHDRVISLLPKQSAGGRRMVYLIAGVGDDRARLQTLARQHGVGEQVQFLGKVRRSDLPDLYRAADLFVLPSTGEGFGIAFLEAMACGTPAMGLAVGGAPDALGDGELGACVTEADFPAALRAATDGHGRLDPNLSARVRGAFGFSVFADRVVATFDRLVA